MIIFRARGRHCSSGTSSAILVTVGPLILSSLCLLALLSHWELCSIWRVLLICQVTEFCNSHIKALRLWKRDFVGIRCKKNRWSITRKEINRTRKSIEIYVVRSLCLPQRKKKEKNLHYLFPLLLFLKFSCIVYVEMSYRYII